MPHVEYIRADLVPRLPQPLSQEDDLTNYERELGGINVKMDAMEQDLRELKSDVRAMRDMMNQTKGGWKVISIIAAGGGAVGALLTKFLPVLIAFR